MSLNTETELREYASTQAGTRLGRTIAALLRSDSDRLTFWSGRSVSQNLSVERLYVPGEDERCAIQAAERFPSLRPCIGWLVCAGTEPQAGAWLVLNDAAVIDPARQYREAVAFLGVALRGVEVARWTPTNPAHVAVSDVSHQKLLA